MKSFILSSTLGFLTVLLIPSCMENDFRNHTENARVPDHVLENMQQEKVNLEQAMVIKNFKAHLSGSEEVPPVDSKATGQAIFRLTDDNELYYKIIVANIENVRMAHIHMAPAGENGSVVVWLYPSSPPPQLIEGRVHGVLAEGTITADNLTGPLAGASFDDLIEAIEQGNTYVNVHTNQAPGGEIRGQIQ